MSTIGTAIFLAYTCMYYLSEVLVLVNKLALVK